ncbi:MAG: DUF3857 domain-containing protein [Acidobacteriota bacterium]
MRTIGKATAVALYLLLTGHPVLAKIPKDIDPNYMALADCPEHPGCPAIVLLDQTELDNRSGRTQYSRKRIVKVFTQDGVDEHGSIELRAVVGGLEIKNLKGRIIQPNGTVSALKRDNVHVKYLRRGKHRVKVKRATFPGVVPGSLIEVTYDVLSAPNSYVTEDMWEIQEWLPVLHARYILEEGKFHLTWKRTGSEDIVVKETSPHKYVKYFDAWNVPPLPREPFGPPIGAIQARYYFGLEGLQGSWLGRFAGLIAGGTGRFIDDASGVKEKVDEIVSPTDARLTKVRKIYRFVQERIQTEEERLRHSDEKTLAEAGNAGDVLSRGFGDEFERTMLFLSMVKAAGLDAGLLLIVGNNNSVFDAKVPDRNQFDSYAAAVKVGMGWTFYDPAARHCPFGRISAEKEGGIPNAVLIRPSKGLGAMKKGLIQGLQIEVHDTTDYSIAAIPVSKAAQNALKRDVHVRLQEDGSAEVEATERGRGLSDLEERRRYMPLGEEERRKRLRDYLVALVPDAELLDASFENLDAFDKPARIKCRFKTASAGTVVGNKMLVTPSIYHASESNPFTAETRRTPVRFHHTWRTQEMVMIVPPDGYAVKELPESLVVREPPFLLMMSFRSVAGKIHVRRTVSIDKVRWPVSEYAALKRFFERVQKADRQTVVLEKEMGP